MNRKYFTILHDGSYWEKTLYWIFRNIVLGFLLDKREYDMKFLELLNLKSLTIFDRVKLSLVHYRNQNL